MNNKKIIYKNKDLDSLISDINDFNEFETFSYDKYEHLNGNIFYKCGSNTDFEHDCFVRELEKDADGNFVWTYDSNEDETCYGFETKTRNIDDDFENADCDWE